MDQVTKHFMQQVVEKAILTMNTIFQRLLFARYYSTTNPFTFKVHNSPVK